MNAFHTLQNPIITHSTALAMLKDYSRPNDKISELIKQKKLISLKRGLYAITGTNNTLAPITANHLYGPSYLSSYWALAYYGLLTERVSVITSMCVGNAKEIATELGTFKYSHLPLAYYSIGLTIVQQDKSTFMIATPEKALADTLVSTRGLRLQSKKAMLSYLLDDLRLDEDDLQMLNANHFNDFAERGFKSQLLNHLSAAIKELQ